MMDRIRRYNVSGLLIVLLILQTTSLQPHRIFVSAGFLRYVGLADKRLLAVQSTPTRWIGGAEIADIPDIRGSGNDNVSSTQKAPNPTNTTEMTTAAADSENLPTPTRRRLWSVMTSSVSLLPQAQMVAQNIRNGLSLLRRMSGRAGPPVLTLLSLAITYNDGDHVNVKNGASFLTVYSLALLGSSCGFYTFLYFITVGYALGVTIPLIVALIVYMVRFLLLRI
jgi:hypothetical protein